MWESTAENISYCPCFYFRFFGAQRIYYLSFAARGEIYLWTLSHCRLPFPYLSASHTFLVITFHVSFYFWPHDIAQCDNALVTLIYHILSPDIV